jgi:hypothetical protein
MSKGTTCVAAATIIPYFICFLRPFGCIMNGIVLWGLDCGAVSALRKTAFSTPLAIV